MKYLPKILIANFILLCSASTAVAANYHSSPIHQNGKMPDGTVVYEQNMPARPQNQSWIYDPSNSSQWKPYNKDEISWGSMQQQQQPGTTTDGAYQANPGSTSTIPSYQSSPNYQTTPNYQSPSSYQNQGLDQSNEMNRFQQR